MTRRRFRFLRLLPLVFCLAPDPSRAQYDFSRYLFGDPVTLGYSKFKAPPPSPPPFPTESDPTILPHLRPSFALARSDRGQIRAPQRPRTPKTGASPFATTPTAHTTPPGQLTATTSPPSDVMEFPHTSSDRPPV